jgi:hypothetical protein
MAHGKRAGPAQKGRDGASFKRRGEGYFGQTECRERVSLRQFGALCRQVCIFGATKRLYPVALGNVSYRNGKTLFVSGTYQTPLQRAYPRTTSLLKYIGVILA